MNQPVLISDRENDNAALVSWDENSCKLTVAAEQRLGSVNNWIRFRLQSLVPGTSLTLDLQQLAEIAGHIPLYVSWDDGSSWVRTNQHEPPYCIDVLGTSLEVSRNLPYPHARLEQWRRQMAQRDLSGIGSVQSLCLSHEQRDVPVFITQAPSRDCPLIWVNARSHAFESHSSHVAEALIHWLVSDDGRFLRERAVVAVVPMIDVDAVAVGSGGKNRSPHDPNRDYVLEHYPQVRAVKSRLEQLTQHHPLSIFVDVHSPWFHNLSLWFIGQQSHEHVAPLTDRFHNILDRIGGANSWYNELRKQERPQTQLVSSTHWARQRWDQAIVVTMEVPHNVDADGRSITHKGLADYARALGLSFEACLAGKR